MVLWLASRYESIEIAHAALDQLCRSLGIDADEEHWMGIALREAMANAIKHGNRQDSGKRVFLSLAAEGPVVTIVVGDEGEGFDTARLADPLAPENQMKTSGRGIFYMKTFMDDVTFARGEAGGTILTMKRDLTVKRETKGVNAR
jgi:serine/threonine-protein kinase RsbW